MEDQHKAAIESRAAERYMLGEMTDAERESFEEHYFNCRYCIEDVKTIDVLAEAVKQPKAQPVPVPAPKRRLMAAAPWAIAASLAGAMTVQTLVMRVPAVTQVAEGPVVGQTSFPAPLLTSAMRAGAERIPVPAGRPITVPVQIDHEPQFVRYVAELRRDGKTIEIVPIPVEETSDTVFVPLSPLPAGGHDVVIEGVRKDGNRSEIIRQSLIAGGS